MSFAPSNLQWLGIAKETTNGTPIAAPTIWVPIDSPAWKPDRPPLIDGALRGSMVSEYNQVQGQGHDELTYTTNNYLDSAYPHLLAVLGVPDTVSGTLDPWTHKTAVYNGSGTDSAQPKSYTLFYADGAGKVQQIPGAIPSTVKFTVKPDGLVQLAVTWIGLPSTAITPPSNTPTTTQPSPGWNAVISLGGSALTTFSEVDVEVKRDTKIIPAITGTTSPYGIFGGPVTVSGSLTAIYQGATDVNMQDFLNNTQPALTVKLSPVGDVVHSLTLQMSKVGYAASAPSGSAGSWMETKASFEGLANTTDALGGGFSPAQAILLSPQSTQF